MAFPMLMLLGLMALIVSFGVGFILNMLTKFWMSSGVAFLAIFVYIMVKAGQGLQIGDWVLLLLLATGSFASAFAIRSLRNRGFRMFQ